MASRTDEITLREYAPRAELRVATNIPVRPRFEVCDAHNHIGHGLLSTTDPYPFQDVSELLGIMDAAGVKTMLDLDGQWGDNLRQEIARYQEPYPDRFVVFSGIDYDNFAGDPDFGETEARRLRESVAIGARGLKVWKLLGLQLRDSQGQLIPINDSRLDPLWATAGELGVPVLIHIADPMAFFQPLDRFNERWEELNRHPDWHFYPTRPKGELMHPDFPSFEELMEQFEDVLTRHSGTTFIGAHFGCNAEDFGWVGRMLDACPNFFVDISARIAEIGRKPFSARDFFIKYQDRILFGTDATPNVDVYRTYYRFLETRDEYFNAGQDEVPGNGRWMIYGLDLPDEALKKIYQGNFQRVVLSQSSSGAK